MTKYKIQRVFEDIWPDVECIFADREYDYISKRRLQQVLAESRIDGIMYRARLMDCDKFALLLHAELVAYKFWKMPELSPFAWAVGQIDVQRPRNRHRMNIAVTTSGVFLVEPQTDKVRRPKDSDRAIRIYM